MGGETVREEAEKRRVIKRREVEEVGGGVAVFDGSGD